MALLRVSYHFEGTCYREEEGIIQYLYGSKCEAANGHLDVGVVCLRYEVLVCCCVPGYEVG
jgi:hypothetical protein